MYGKDRDGVGRPPIMDSDGILITRSPLYDAALQGRLFSVANQTNVTTTAALATTWTGLGVGNPATSGKDYVFHEFGWAQEVVMNTEGSFGLMVATVCKVGCRIDQCALRQWGNNRNAHSDQAFWKLNGRRYFNSSEPWWKYL